MKKDKKTNNTLQNTVNNSLSYLFKADKQLTATKYRNWSIDKKQYGKKNPTRQGYTSFVFKGQDLN